ncbi:alpha-1,4-glucan--maltose-1-phosphate maltosyltransferase [Sphingomonas sp. DT-51]|uniref:alpha-1,4-glucan--maltose-1-phosphate maltosyltransferase n=1 Tax=Sphingomonas sp. DT-51 TaxID=3396165 RepID=UPI003F1D9F63
MPRSDLRIVSLHTDLVSAPSDAAEETFSTAAAAGFDAAIWRIDRPLLDIDPVPDALLTRCRDARLRPILEVDLSRFSLGHSLVASYPDAFAVRRSGTLESPVDPRARLVIAGEARARLRSPETVALLRQPLTDALTGLVDRGAGGFRLIGADRNLPSFVGELIDTVRQRAPDVMFIAGTPDLSRARTLALAHAGLDAVVSSFNWWDLRAPWLVEEYRALRPIAPLLSEIRPDTLTRADDPALLQQRLAAAAAVGDGVILPATLLGTGDEAREAVRRVLELTGTVSHFAGEMRRLSGSAAGVTALLRADKADVRDAAEALLILINTDAQPQPAPDPALLLPGAGAAFASFERVDGSSDAFAQMRGGEVRALTAARSQSITLSIIEPSDSALAAGSANRLVVEDVRPGIDGNFPVKRVVGESVAVDATVFADGHEQLAAELLWREAGAQTWNAVRMEQLPNDGWRAAFPLARLGRHEFAVEGWLDRFGGFRRDFRKKLDAGVAQAVDHAEGRVLVDAAVARGANLGDWPARLAAAGDGDESASLLLSPELAAAMDAADDRPHRIRSNVQPVDAERLQARFSSWYELFPRSITDDPARHGTFIDVLDRLPAIREMGFDTLYFPPIHPIGRTHRKGPNNTLIAGPDDPGSPYAIGSKDGGHDAIHPELGSFEDFGRLVAAAADHGLEIALDFAIQASPDHPWLTEHPGWFSWRPDGSMKYAENPPKKYQDIVNVDFYGSEAVPDLWLALRDVILLWIGQGVKTFRVDNPHTKPLPFWEWMIGEVRAAHPEVIFLAEAFTRPSMMYRLAKIGFSQSYTYFTWRDRKDELIEYITELTTTAPKEFYRPHFFVNTPDINPVFLQTSGRPGFRIRAVLAATLSGLFGVYSGFELCEAAPVPGKEEYLDSEKYVVKPRDWQAPGNIIADITLLNNLRRAHPALQTHLNTRFYPAYNDNIIYYAKPAHDGTDMILVMVNLDPHAAQECDFEVPLWEFGLSDHDSIAVEDLAGGYRFHWQGKTQHIHLAPDEPYRIWRIAPGDFA